MLTVQSFFCEGVLLFINWRIFLYVGKLSVASDCCILHLARLNL